MAVELSPPWKGRPTRTSDSRYISSDNPLGLNPNDPNGQDDLVIVADDLHLPLGKPVKVLLRSIDVIHDFYVPEFRAKMDLMPGLVTYSGSILPEPGLSRFLRGILWRWSPGDAWQCRG